MSVVFVGDEYLGLGFRLIGIKSEVVVDEVSAEKTLYSLIENQDVDAIVLSESLYVKLVSRGFKFKREGGEKPILIVVPDLKGSLGRRTEDIYNLISQAVGVKLEFKR